MHWDEKSMFTVAASFEERARGCFSRAELGMVRLWGRRLILCY